MHTIYCQIFRIMETLSFRRKTQFPLRHQCSAQRLVHHNEAVFPLATERKLSWRSGVLFSAFLAGERRKESRLN